MSDFEQMAARHLACPECAASDAGHFGRALLKSGDTSSCADQDHEGFLSLNIHALVPLNRQDSEAITAAFSSAFAKLDP